MQENTYILSYLRKGLGQYINKDSQHTEDGRATINLKVNLKGNSVKSNTEVKIDPKKTTFNLSLVGPADVKQVNPSIISQFYPPAINTQRFNPNTMPFMEFYEADFPWRYTPLAVEENKNCTPWLVLVAVNEDEYKMETKEGKKKVEFIFSSEERYNNVFPTTALHSKLAHVQLEKTGDEDGISRLLCASQLDQGKHVTVFLLPAFEIGRLSGLGENYKGVDIKQLSWKNGARVFPVYHHWSFNTDTQSGSFEILANKLEMKPASAYNSLKAYLTVDIAENGLANDGLQDYRNNNKECVIDVPAALIPALGKNPTLRTENDYYPKDSETYKDRLKKELLLNPVFVENATGKLPTNEDPWIEPPVYGARHLLSVNLDKDDVVAEVNLNLCHRIAAGMGASVVKENQESFVHRAWQKVEKINELNQELREFYEMQEVEQKADRRLTKETARIKKLWDNSRLPRRRVRQLTSDALPRTLNASKITQDRVSANDVQQVVNNNWEPVQKEVRIIGITPEELSALFNPNTWKTLLEDDIKTIIANQMIEQYKKENNWMQYLLNPYYNLNKQKICGIRPAELYEPKSNNNMINEACNELFFWLYQGWSDKYISDEAHTLDYYFNAARNATWPLLRELFPKNFTIRASYPISEVVYPLTLFSVHVWNKDKQNYGLYYGYIMDDKLFKKKFGDKSYIAFEYDLKSGSSVKPELKYIFLFPSNYKGLSYVKYFNHYDKKGKSLTSLFARFEFEENHVKHASCPWVDDESIFKPFTDNGFILKKYSKVGESPFSMLEKTFYGEQNYSLCDEYYSNNLGAIRYNAEHEVDISVYSRKRKFFIEVDDLKNKDKAGQNKELYRLYYRLLCGFRDNLEMLNEIWYCCPSYADVSLSSIDKQCIMRVEDFGLSLDEKNIQNNEIYKRYNALIEKLKNISGVSSLPKVKEEPEPDTPNLEEEKRDTIDALVKKYGYTEKAQLNEIKNQILRGKLSKYPVMIYPDFLDPTFFYLRELSENYIVPSAGELTNNSVTVFQSNTAFEEAFLMGMNTEMGQELLWREYPTDQRGSYFRKFWVAAQLPEKENLENQYFDIKKIHNWEKTLGNNHVKQNAQMLVFAIKGELMQAYPKTTIYLSSYQYHPKQKITSIAARYHTSMTAWLTEDTYLVGFEGIDMQKVKDENLVLTFQQDVTGLQFDFPAMNATYKNSAELAMNLKKTSSVFILPIPLNN